MLVGDPHCEPDDTSASDNARIKDYLSFQYAAIEKEKPDLVILMGDNASGENAEAFDKTLRRITKPYADSGTPFSFILGNHDLQRGVTDLTAQYEIYRALPYCYMPEKTDPYGDFSFYVYNTDGTAPALEILNIYSGSGADEKDYGAYAHVTKPQNDWIRSTCAKTAAAYGRVPAVLFQHIPVQEEFELLQKTSFLSMLTDGVTGQNEKQGDFYRLKSSTKGYMGEAPCTAAFNSGEFEAIKNTNTIFAMFFGHDHMNDFTGMYDGIFMGQCKLASFNAYGDGLMQGVRILEFDENKPFHLDTRMVYYRDIFGDVCRSIHGAAKRLRDRTSVKLETSIKIFAGVSGVILPAVLLRLLHGNQHG